MSSGSLVLLERAAELLGDLGSRFVYCGAACVPLWISDPGAQEPWPTSDVDVIVEVSTRFQYDELLSPLRDRGFSRDPHRRHTWAWKHGSQLKLDVIPAFFSHRLRAAFSRARTITLPSGRAIRAVSPPHLLALKLDAFERRGSGDLAGSRDFEDATRLVDGRQELLDEVRMAEAELRAFVAEALVRLRSDHDLEFGVGAHLPGDIESQRRVATVISRLDALIDVGS